MEGLIREIIMSDDIETNPPDRKKSRLPVVIVSILGIALIGYCVFGVLFLFKPDPISIPEISTSSPNATLIPVTVPQANPTIQALATNSASQWSILFSDTFDEDQNYWPIENASDENYDDILEIKDGKYLWSFTSKNSFSAITSPTIVDVTDFHLSADLKLTSGTYKPVYGLVFRDNVNGDLYKFGIYGEGFMVDMYYNQVWTSLIEYTKSSAISPQETNRLTVIAEGPHFTFFINNQYVAEVTDDHIKDGIVGFGVDVPIGGLQNSFEFDNFVLRIPE